MSGIPKTSGSPPVDATLPGRSGAAASGISLKSQPALHSDPSDAGVPVRVRLAATVPATHAQIRKQASPSSSPPPDDAAIVAAVAQRLVTDGHFSPQLVDKWAQTRALSSPSDAQKNEYTRISCTILKSVRVSVSEARSIARDAVRFMMPGTG